METMLKPSAILTAIGAGFASAVLYASLIGGTLLAIPLFALSSLPIIIAALGWGTLAGLIAAGTAAIVIGIALAPMVAVIYLLATALPAVVLSHLLGLAQTPDAATDAAPGVAQDWFPIGWIIFAGGVIVAVSTVLGGFIVGYDEVETSRSVADSMIALMERDGAGAAAEIRAEIEPFVTLSVRLLPTLFPIMWTVNVLFNLWLGAKVVARSGRLARPWEDLARFQLPRGTGLGLVAAVLLSFLPAPIGLIAAPFAGALLCTFMMLGFAVLHVVTRGLPARGILLGILYLIIFVFTVPAILVAVVGMLEVAFRFRDRRRGGLPTTKP
jgi:hypothetical protein